MANRWASIDPWREIRQLQQEMNHVFESAFGRPAIAFPACNVFAGDADLLVTCAMSGVELDELDISVMGDTLTIKGERKPPEGTQNAACHRRERRTGAFTRTVQLPNRVDPEHVEANYDNGILKVTLNKAPEEKPRKIEIKTA